MSRYNVENTFEKLLLKLACVNIALNLHLPKTFISQKPSALLKRGILEYVRSEFFSVLDIIRMNEYVELPNKRVSWKSTRTDFSHENFICLVDFVLMLQMTLISITV